MNCRAWLGAAAAAGIATVAASRAVAGNRWMMEGMADDLNRVNEQAVRAVPLPASGRVQLEATAKVRLEKLPIVRVVRATVARTSGGQPLPLEMAGTPAYESLTREASLDIPVVVSK